MSDQLMMCYECEWVGPQEQAVWRAETWPLCPACYAQARENEVFEIPVHLADAWRVRERAEAELAAEVAREAIDEGDYLRRRLLERGDAESAFARDEARESQLAAAEQALREFDAAHPEVLTALEAERRAATDRAMWL